MTYKISKEKNSKIELEVKFEAVEFMTFWNKAFKAVQAEIEIDGFRKGNVPENMIVAKYGESAIINEMANIAINESYPKIILEESQKNNMKPIDEPHIHVVSAVKGADFVYHAHVTVYPEFTLPEYKKISSEIIKVEKKDIADTTDEEVKSVMDQLDEKVKSETEDIENKIKENMKLEKTLVEKSRVRSIMLEKMIEAVEGADKEKAKEMWPENFTDKDKSQIILLEIAKKENISVTKEEIEAEMMKIMMYMNPADINTGKTDEGRLRAYGEQIIINEKVLTFLEN